MPLMIFFLSCNWKTVSIIDSQTWATHDKFKSPPTYITYYAEIIEVALVDMKVEHQDKMNVDLSTSAT